MRLCVSEACALLNDGQVAALPTETVYGLAARLDSPKAIETIYTLKGRPSNNPLIIHLAEASDALPFIEEIPPDFHALAHAYWPGPLTLVVPSKTQALPKVATAGLSTAAFRVQSHTKTKEVLLQTGPLVMPSANLSGRPSATAPKHVEEDFGINFPVLDGGLCTQGVESTILIYCEGLWALGRYGAISPENIGKILGYEPAPPSKISRDRPLCPGQLYRHYAPRAKLILEGSAPPPAAEAVVGFNDRIYPAGIPLFTLGPSDDAAMVAKNLYSTLRALDSAGIGSAWVDRDMPAHGLFATIRERLRRAAGENNSLNK